MKTYLMTIVIRDGENEYFHRWIFECKDNISDILVLTAFVGCDTEDWSVFSPSWYENANDYRHFQVWSRQEIDEKDVLTLQKYGL